MRRLLLFSRSVQTIRKYDNKKWQDAFWITLKSILPLYCLNYLLAAKIINVPGASDVFDQGYITYSNKSKRKILDVSKATLKKYGAVSEQTAREMALGGVLAADADACVAVTGLAGPDGGTEEKPVGLVYVSCCMKDEVIVEECHFNGTRQEIREHAAVTALDLLRRMIIRSRQ